MGEIVVAVWSILCGLAMFALFAFRRRNGSAKIIKTIQRLVPGFDPRILLVWGSFAIVMGLLVLLV